MAHKYAYIAGATSVQIATTVVSVQGIVQADSQCIIYDTASGSTSGTEMARVIGSGAGAFGFQALPNVKVNEGLFVNNPSSNPLTVLYGTEPGDSTSTYVFLNDSAVQAKSSAGSLTGINVGTGDPQIDIYDSATGSTVTQILEVPAGSPTGLVELPSIPFTSGLYVVASSFGEVTVFYE